MVSFQPYNTQTRNSRQLNIVSCITIRELSVCQLKGHVSSRKSSRLHILNNVDGKIKLNPVRSNSTEKLLSRLYRDCCFLTWLTCYSRSVSHGWAGSGSALTFKKDREICNNLSTIINKVQINTKPEIEQDKKDKPPVKAENSPHQCPESIIFEVDLALVLSSRT